MLFKSIWKANNYKFIMKRIVSILILCLTLALPLQAQENPPIYTGIQTYLRGTVENIQYQKEINACGNDVEIRNITIRLTPPQASEDTVVVTERVDIQIVNQPKTKIGDKVVILKTVDNESVDYFITDYNRLPMLGLVTVIFLLAVILLSRWKGFLSLLALAISLFTLIRFIAPAILNGGNPLLISLVGVCALIIPMFYLGHGWNKKTTIAALATFISVILAAVIATIFVSLTRLAGLGSEEAAMLQLNSEQTINLSGLLLGGMIIGALGVLDDITIAQTTAIAELKEVNQTLTGWDLYRRGLKLGREHIASLVNTLALAYVGASFPLFLLFTLNSSQPVWAIINSEIIAEEIIRALVGSMALVLAVPIASALAAYVFGKTSKK